MLSELTLKKDVRTFSVCPENPTGEKGKGGMATLENGSARNAARDLGQGWKVNPYIVMQAGETAVLADVKGQGAIKHIWITDSAKRGRDLIFRIYFDGHEKPSVNVPLSDFFCNSDYNDYRQISSLAICFNPKKGMNSYFEMPYFTGFRIEIENVSPENGICIFYQIDCEEKEIPKESLYFHAQFRRVKTLPYMSDYTILDGIKGNGLYVGTHLYWGVKENGWWGEGEIKFYIDGDKEFPSICGTGTEDYFCGAYNFDVKGSYTEFSTPYTGLSKVNSTDRLYKCQDYFDMYRWHITDPIYFKEDLKVTIQALGWRSEGRYLPRQDDISSVAYWYSDDAESGYIPMPSRDELEIL